MNFLRTAATSVLLASPLAAASPTTAIAADEILLAQGAPQPAAKDDDDDRRKGRRDGGERRDGAGGGGGRERGEDRGGRDRGEDRGGRERGDRNRDGGGRPDQQRQQAAPPVQQQAPAPARREAPPPPPAQRQVVPPTQPPPARAEKPSKLEDLRNRMRDRAQQNDRRDDRRDDRGRDRDDQGRDNRPPFQVQDRRNPPPPQAGPQRFENRRDDLRPSTPQAGPRRLETFKDRFKSRVGNGNDDKFFQDRRRGRDERFRERRARTQFKGIEDLKRGRQERREGNRVVIEEPDKRSIIREGGRAFIRTDENERLRRNFRDVRREKINGRDVTVAIGAGGVQIFTDFDDDGRPRRRWRRGPDGRDIVLFDNSRSRRWGNRHGHSHGGFFDAIIDLPPPRLRIPRDEYIVDYDRASDEDLYDTLTAPPVEELDDRYSLDEIRSSYTIRDRMRRIDLDTINFAFGSWEVEEQDYDRLERVAKAMRRVLRRNSDEMFLIEGHTDAVGSDEDNLTLSDRRAESVARILSEEFEVPAENLTTQGYGEQFLKIDTEGPERQNRRVAIRRITPLLAR